jgi:hypothetical protein
MRGVLSRKLWLSAVVALPVLAPPSHADDWQFEVAPYLWVAGMDGDITIEGQDFDVSADFEDILDQTRYGGSVILAANRGHWVNFLQLDYLALEDDDIEPRRSREFIVRDDLHLEVDTLLLTAATGYRVPIGQRHSLDVMAGLRYAGIKTDIDRNRAGNLNSDRDIYDGIVMVRPQIRFGDHWYLMPSFSVGTGDSDLTWEVFPEIIYQPGDLRFRFGYRNLNYDSGENDEEIDFSMRGLLLGVGFLF